METGGPTRPSFDGSGDKVTAYFNSKMDACPSFDPGGSGAFDGSLMTGLTQIVEGGNTLTGIAQQYGTTVSAIIQANPNITDPNKILIGQTVNIPKTNPSTDQQYSWEPFELSSTIFSSRYNLCDNNYNG